MREERLSVERERDRERERERETERENIRKKIEVGMQENREAKRWM